MVLITTDAVLGADVRQLSESILGPQDPEDEWG